MFYSVRVEKYDGYIRVKKLASLGKKFERTKKLAKTSYFREDFWTNYHKLIVHSHLFITRNLFCRFEVLKISRFTRFSRGKIWFDGFGPCELKDLTFCNSGWVMGMVNGHKASLWVSRQTWWKLEVSHWVCDEAGHGVSLMVCCVSFYKLYHKPQKPLYVSKF